MANVQLFQLRDLNAGTATGPIMAERREGPAIRAFHEILSNDKTTPGMYPDDYVLLKVGDQDDETGQITATTPPQEVASGKQWREAREGTAASGVKQVSPLRGSDIPELLSEAQHEAIRNHATKTINERNR